MKRKKNVGNVSGVVKLGCWNVVRLVSQIDY